MGDAGTVAITMIDKPELYQELSTDSSA